MTGAEFFVERREVPPPPAPFAALPAEPRRCLWCAAQEWSPRGYEARTVRVDRLPACRIHTQDRDEVAESLAVLIRKARRGRKAAAKARRKASALARIPLMPEPARTRALLRATWEDTVRTRDAAIADELRLRALYFGARR